MSMLSSMKTSSPEIDVRDGTHSSKEWFRRRIGVLSHLCPLIVEMSSDVMWYSGQSYPVIYRATRGLGLVKRLRCSYVFKQKYSFKGVGTSRKFDQYFLITTDEQPDWFQENLLSAWSLRTGSLASLTHITFLEVLSFLR